MAATNISVPRVSSSCPLLLQEALQDHQVSLTPAPFKLLLLPWVPVHARFCVHPLRVESLFSTALWSHESKRHWPSKPNVLAACFLSAGPPGWGAYVGLRPLAPLVEPLQCNYPPVCGVPT